MVVMDKSSQREHNVRSLAWGLTVLVAFVAIIGWGQSLQWQLDSLSSYQIFPLLGLIAFSLLWSHYMVGALQRYLKLDHAVFKNYYELTGYAVLLAILLHPGLLIWQLWQDGVGLPPNSYLTYVGKSMHATVILGTISLVLFLAYELRRIFGNKSWWKYISSASDIGMLLIVIHSLRLGSQLQYGWLQTVWYFYGISLIMALIYKYLHHQPQKSL